MITAFVRFPLPQSITCDEAKQMFEKSAQNYRGVSGLVRKYYLYGDDQTGGGFISGTAGTLRSASIPMLGRTWSHNDSERSQKFCSSKPQ